MVDIAGHVAFALLASIPIWFIADRRGAALAFLAVSVPFGLMPDIDLWIERVFPQLIHHHGITHTILFVAVVAAILGPILGRWLHSYLVDHSEIGPDDTGRSMAFGVIAVLTGGLSHLFADMLSAPDIAQPIEPFWPIYQQVVYIDVFYYNAFWPNFGLLAIALLITAGLWAWKGNGRSDDRASSV